jgi:hypothetical protein
MTDTTEANTADTAEDLDLRTMTGILVTPRLASGQPDLIEVSVKPAGESTGDWIRRAVGCQLFDVVTFDGPSRAWVDAVFGPSAADCTFDMWIDDEGLLNHAQPNMMASMLFANPDTGHAPILVGRALIVPTQRDGATRGFPDTGDTLTEVCDELNRVAGAVFRVWESSPEGQAARLLGLMDNATS